MLSLFPELLFLAPFSAFLIRVAVAVVLAMIAQRRIRSGESYSVSLGAVEAVLALMLLIGLYTQAAALTALVLAIVSLFYPAIRTAPRSTLALMAVMLLTLLLTGPGPFAFDLPL